MDEKEAFFKAKIGKNIECLNKVETPQKWRILTF
jgi:hypothetical protein